MKSEDFGAKPPDGGYGWVVLFAAFVISMICDGVLYAFGAIMIHLQSYFGASYRSISAIGSVANGVYLLGGIVTAKFINRFGCRKITFAGGIITCIAMLISIMSPSTVFMIFSYGILGGFGFSLIYLPSVVAVSHYFDSKLSIALGINTAGSGLGTIIFSPLSNFLYQEYGWKGGMLIMSAVILNCCAFGILLRPLKLVSDSNKCNGASREAKSTEDHSETVIADHNFQMETEKNPNNKNKIKNLRNETCKFLSDVANFSLLKDVRIVVICFANVLSMIGYYVPYVFLSSLAVSYGINNEKAALLISIIGISNTISRIISGFIPKLFGISSLMVNNIGLIMSFLVTIFMPLYRSFSLLAAYAAAFGFFIAPHISLTPVFLENMVGKEKISDALGLCFFFRGITSIIAPPICGSLKDTTGSYTIPFILCASSFLVSGLMHFLVYPLQRWRQCKKAEYT